MSELPDELRRLVSQTLKIPLENVSPETSAETEAKWTSMSHLNLILAVEDHLGREMPTEVLVEVTSVSDLADFWRASLD